jgi:hypothetical protein
MDYELEQQNTSLDDEWIQNFEKVDELYKDFYKDDVYFTNLKIVYVNRSNEIEKIIQDNFLMSEPNCITREEILQILKRYALEDDRKYSLLSIVRYNIVLEPNEIKHYLLEKDDFDKDADFLQVINHIDSIYFEKTINMFQDLNEIVLLFYEKSGDLKQVDPNKCTKKIYFYKSLSSKKRTIKKRYKD